MKGVPESVSMYGMAGRMIWRCLNESISSGWKISRLRISGRVLASLGPVLKRKSRNALGIAAYTWRRGGDSNPRYPCEYSFFETDPFNHSGTSPFRFWGPRSGPSYRTQRFHWSLLLTQHHPSNPPMTQGQQLAHMMTAQGNTLIAFQ